MLRISALLAVMVAALATVTAARGPTEPGVMMNGQDTEIENITSGETKSPPRTFTQPGEY